MSRKRKSDAISIHEDVQVIDLSNEFIAREATPTESVRRTRKRVANPIPKRDGNEGEKTGFQLDLSAMNLATKALNDSAKFTRRNNIQCDRSTFTHGRTSSHETDVGHNMEPPADEPVSQNNAMTRHAHTEASVEKYDRIHPRSSSTAQQPRGHDIHVIDLDSDGDEGEAPDSGKQYEVEAVLRRRGSEAEGVQYLVKWRGFSEEDNTWESVSNLQGAKSLIEEFEVSRTNHEPESQQQIDDTSQSLRTMKGLKYLGEHRNSSSPRYQIYLPIPEAVGELEGCRYLPMEDRYEYLVEWKGLPPIQSSWEEEDRFSSYPQLIWEYHGLINTRADSDKRKIKTVYDHPPEPMDILSDSSTNMQTSERYGLYRNPVRPPENVYAVIGSSRGLTGDQMSYLVYSDGGSSYSWHPASDLVSTEAQDAIQRFIRGSKLCANYLEQNESLEHEKPRRVPKFPRTKEVKSIVSHRLTDAVVEYHVRWKYHHDTSWETLKTISNFRNSESAVETFQEIMQKYLKSRMPREVWDKVNTDPTVKTVLNGGIQMMAIFTPESIQKATKITNRFISKRASRALLFSRSCTECESANIHCEGSEKCHRCLRMDLRCCYASHADFEREVAQMWPKNPFKQSNSTLSSLLSTKSRTQGRNNEINGLDAGSTISSTQRKRPQSKFERLEENEIWINTRATWKFACMTEDDKWWIGKHLMEYPGLTPALRENKIDPIQFFVRREVEKELREETALNELMANSMMQSDEVLTIGGKTAKSTSLQGSGIGIDGRYIVVKKAELGLRPLPSCPPNKHNLASNILLAIGKHPWLPGLNHHLRGLLDKNSAGRVDPDARRQDERAEKFRKYEAPSSPSEIAKANRRATWALDRMPPQDKLCELCRILNAQCIICRK